MSDCVTERHSATIASLLGLESECPAMSDLALLDRIEHGLAIGTLQQISRLYAPEDRHFAYRLVPKATLDRRKQHDRLTPAEGEKVARLARIWAAAMDVWQEEEQARAFLSRRHPMLDGKKPADLVLSSELGAKLVEGILGRLKHGTAA